MDSSEVKAKVVHRYIIQFLLTEFIGFNSLAIVLSFIFPTKLDMMVHLTVLSAIGATTSYFYLRGNFLRDVDSYINSKCKEEERDFEVAKRFIKENKED